MILYLNSEEKYHLEAIIAKRNNLALQDQLLQKEMDNIIAEFCKRNSVEVTKATNLNIEAGFIEFEDEEKKNKPKK